MHHYLTIALALPGGDGSKKTQVPMIGKKMKKLNEATHFVHGCGGKGATVGEQQQ